MQDFEKERQFVRNSFFKYLQANGINGEKDVSYFDDALFFEIEEGEGN